MRFTAVRKMNSKNIGPIKFIVVRPFLSLSLSHTHTPHTHTDINTHLSLTDTHTHTHTHTHTCLLYTSDAADDC